MPIDDRRVDGERDIALVVGAARSGTTLLRLVLDAHPEIAAPGETGIAALMAHLTNVWTVASGVSASRHDELPHWLREQVRRAAQAPIEHACEKQRARLFCDKSLDSVDSLDAVAWLFPNARYVLIFRHVMDTIASGLDASPWGFDAYGYLPYVSPNPANFVAGLAGYWVTQIDKALAWEARNPERCLRVHYEDLVAEPERVVSEVFRFLGVADDRDAIARAFGRTDALSGPRDYKVGFSDGVHRDSVGRGKRVPVGKLPPPLLDAVNEKLGAVGYAPLSATWNVEPAATPANAGRTAAGARLELLMAALERRGVGRDPTIGSYLLLAADDAELRWIVEPASGDVRAGDGSVDTVITADTADLVAMLTNSENLGALIIEGRVRQLTGTAAPTLTELMESLRPRAALLRLAVEEMR